MTNTFQSCNGVQILHENIIGLLNQMQVRILLSVIVQKMKFFALNVSLDQAYLKVSLNGLIPSN